MRVRPYCRGYDNGCICTDCDERHQFEQHEWQMYLANLDDSPPPEISLDEEFF